MKEIGPGREPLHLGEFVLDEAVDDLGVGLPGMSTWGDDAMFLALDVFIETGKG